MKRKDETYKIYKIVISILVGTLLFFSSIVAIKVHAEEKPETIVDIVEEAVEEMKEVIDNIPTCTDESIKKEDLFLKIVEKRYNKNISEPEEVEEHEDYTEETYEEEVYETYTTTYSPDYLRTMGVVYDGGFRYTWYSERVLPGGGLNIQGRWSDGNFVRDGDGYICVASEDFAKGTVLETPWGMAKVYDRGCAHGTIDVYTSW